MDKYRNIDSDDLNDNLDLSSLQYKEKLPEPKAEPKAKPEPKLKAEPKLKPEPKIKNEKALIKPSLKSIQVSNKKQVEKLNDEEIINKRRLILLIQFYMLEFPEKLKTFKKIKLENKTIDELQDLKTEFDYIIGSKSNVQTITQIISSGIQGLEIFLLNFTPVNCKGLSNICNDPEALDDMKHIALRNCQLVSTDPEYRLMYKILTTTLVLHKVNSDIELNNENINNINNEFVDI